MSRIGDIAIGIIIGVGGIIGAALAWDVYERSGSSGSGSNTGDAPEEDTVLSENSEDEGIPDTIDSSLDASDKIIT